MLDRDCLQESGSLTKSGVIHIASVRRAIALRVRHRLCAFHVSDRSSGVISHLWLTVDFGRRCCPSSLHFIVFGDG